MTAPVLAAGAGAPGSPSTVGTAGTLTTLSSSLRVLSSRAGTYPAGATDRLDPDSSSPNTAVGACPRCHGLGVVHDVTGATLVPGPGLSIREGATAAWPGAWQGENLRGVLVRLARARRGHPLYLLDEPTPGCTPPTSSA